MQVRSESHRGDLQASHCKQAQQTLADTQHSRVCESADAACKVWHLLDRQRQLLRHLQVDLLPHAQICSF